MNLKTARQIYNFKKIIKNNVIKELNDSIIKNELQKYLHESYLASYMQAGQKIPQNDLNNRVALLNSCTAFFFNASIDQRNDLNFRETVLAFKTALYTHQTIREASEPGFKFIVQNSVYIGKIINRVSMRLFRIDQNPIYTGKVATTFHCTELNTGTKKVLKLSSPFKKGSDCPYMASELNMLDYLHKKGGNYSGFQRAIDMEVFITENNGTTQRGYFSPAEEMTLSDWMCNKKITPIARLQCCQQLMQICEKLASLNIWHADIKPLNILASSINNSWNFRVIDFAGARYFDEKNETFKKPTYTLKYFHPNDYMAIKEALSEKNAKKLYQVGLRHDQYAMCTTFFNTLCGGTIYPYATQATKCNNLSVKICIDPNSEVDSTPLIKRGYSEKIINFLCKCLDRNPQKRPSLVEMVDFWNTLDFKTALVGERFIQITEVDKKEEKKDNKMDEKKNDKNTKTDKDAKNSKHEVSEKS